MKLKSIKEYEEEISIGDIVKVEECWEDTTGAYHDEFAEVISLNPIKLNFLDVPDKLREFLNACEFRLEDLGK